jgi:uncharacterized protein YbjT (DUF2867 family)
MAAARPLIVLTGTPGFVGRQVLRALAERSCRLRLLVRDGKQKAISPAETIEDIVAPQDRWSESAASYRG